MDRYRQNDSKAFFYISVFIEREICYIYIGESSEEKERFKGCIQIIPKFLIYIIIV